MIDSPSKQEWLVPMRLAFRDAHVRVLAATAEEAERLAGEGEWDGVPVEGECVDFYVTGSAVEETGK